MYRHLGSAEAGKLLAEIHKLAKIRAGENSLDQGLCA